jgi:hypothetical protein
MATSGSIAIQVVAGNKLMYVLISTPRSDNNAKEIFDMFDKAIIEMDKDP